MFYPSLLLVSLYFRLPLRPPFYYLHSFTLYNLTENFQRCLPGNSCTPFPAVLRIDSGACHISLGGDMSRELLPTLEKSIPISFLALFPRILRTVCHFLKHTKGLSLLRGFRKIFKLIALRPFVSILLCPNNSCIFSLSAMALRYSPPSCVAVLYDT